MIKNLIDDNIWKGGWYQDITFPNGEKSISTMNKFGDSNGLKKWDIIKPYLRKGKFLDIGCNAGLFLVKASEHYETLYGIEKSQYFIKQGVYVLKQFGIDANVINSDVLDVEWNKIPLIDTTIAMNSLYWIGYSDEEGYIPDWESLIDIFLTRLSMNTKELVTVGSETVDRFGGTVNQTVEKLKEHFDIIETKLCPLNDRVLNVIYARSTNTKHNK